MRRLPIRRFPTCHLGHVPAAGSGRRSRTAVWICEYPYRTMKLTGPSIECADCPVWQEMERARAAAAARAEEIRALETMIAL